MWVNYETVHWGKCFSDMVVTSVDFSWALRCFLTLNEISDWDRRRSIELKQSKQKDIIAWITSQRSAKDKNTLLWWGGDDTFVLCVQLQQLCPYVLSLPAGVHLKWRGLWNNCLSFPAGVCLCVFAEPPLFNHLFIVSLSRPHVPTANISHTLVILA